MPGVRVGRHARLRRVIVDRDVFIPRGALHRLRPRRKIASGTPSPTRASSSSRRTTSRCVVEIPTPARWRSKQDADRRGAPAASELTPPSSLPSIPRRLIRDHHDAARPRDPRLARQPHRRSRRHPGQRRLRARGRAVGRLDRHPRSARTARRRQEALPRQGRHDAPSANVNGEIAAAVDRQGPRPARRSTTAMIALDGTPTKSRLGANALLGVSMAFARAARRRARRRRSTSTSAACYGAGARGAAARADDEHPQRRRARRQQRRLPGVHGDARWASPTLPPRRCAPASRSSTR